MSKQEIEDSVSESVDVSELSESASVFEPQSLSDHFADSDLEGDSDAADTDVKTEETEAKSNDKASKKNPNPFNFNLHTNDLVCYIYIEIPDFHLHSSYMMFFILCFYSLNKQLMMSWRKLRYILILKHQMLRTLCMNMFVFWVYPKHLKLIPNRHLHLWYLVLMKNAANSVLRTIFTCLLIIWVSVEGQLIMQTSMHTKINIYLQKPAKKLGKQLTLGKSSVVIMYFYLCWYRFEWQYAFDLRSVHIGTIDMEIQ